MAGLELRHAIKDYYNHPEKRDKEALRIIDSQKPSPQSHSLVHETWLPIDLIVAKYTPVGMSFEDAEHVLEGAGFMLLPLPPRTPYVRTDDFFVDGKKLTPMENIDINNFKLLPPSYGMGNFSEPSIFETLPNRMRGEYLEDIRYNDVNAIVGELQLAVMLFQTDKAVIILYPEKHGTFDTNVAWIYAVLFYRSAMCC